MNSSVVVCVNTVMSEQQQQQQQLKRSFSQHSRREQQQRRRIRRRIILIPSHHETRSKSYFGICCCIIVNIIIIIIIVVMAVVLCNNNYSINDIQVVVHALQFGSSSSSSSSSVPSFSRLLNLKSQQKIIKIGRISAGRNNQNTSNNLTISQLGIGTWSWGNRLLYNYNTTQDVEIYNAYRILRNSGITLFDTADSYGTLDLNGRAEILLGQFERQYQNELLTSTTSTEWWKLGSSTNTPQRINQNQQQQQQQQQQQVATKLAPYPWRITRNSTVNAGRNSLLRLQQDKLCIAQLHWSTSNYLPYQERILWEGICDIYDKELCTAVGVSNYGPQQLIKVNDYIQKERNVPLAIAQIQYSLMTYGTGQYMNEVCDSEVGCRLVSYSPLCLGLLTGKYNLDNLPPPGNPRRQLFRELLPGATQLLQTLDAIGKEYDHKSSSQIAINWAICKGTVPIPGCRTVQQATSHIEATQFRLQPDAIAELDRVALAIKKPMIQNIFQTK